MVRFNVTDLTRDILLGLILIVVLLLAWITNANREADADRRHEEAVEKLLDDWHPEARDFGWESASGDDSP